MAEAVLVTGDDLLVESALLDERARALGGLDPTWSLTELEPGSGFLEHLGATAMMGLGADRRVVVVRRAGALDPSSWDGLLGYLRDLPEHVSIVLEGKGWTVPARSRALNEAVTKAGGRVRKEDLPAPAKRPDMVRREAARRNIRLDAEAARYLSEYLGDEIGNLPGVLEQLTAVYRGKARLSEAEVAAQFQGARHGFQWDITDALDRGDANAALEFVHGALETNHPIPLVAALVTHYRRILGVVGRTLSPGQAAAELGMKEFPARKVVEQAERLGVDNARRAYELLAAADLALRGGGSALDGPAVIDVLIVRLAALSPRAAPRRPRPAPRGA